MGAGSGGWVDIFAKMASDLVSPALANAIVISVHRARRGFRLRRRPGCLYYTIFRRSTGSMVGRGIAAEMADTRKGETP